MGGRSSNNPNFLKMVRQRRVTVWDMRYCKISYDEGWRELMGEVSKEVGIPVEDVERLNSAWWRYVHEMMGNPVLPTIRIVYLCTLRPSVRVLFMYCERMKDLIMRIYRGDVADSQKRIGDAKGMELHLRKLHDTYYRLLEEAASRKKVVAELSKREYIAGVQKDLDDWLVNKAPFIGVTMKEARRRAAANDLKKENKKQDDTKI